MALAVVALALRVAIPAGYMIAPAAQAGEAPQMVICTGQGAMTVAVADSDKAPIKAPAKAVDHPCAFAAAGVPIPTPTTDGLAAPAVAYAAEIVSPTPRQRPGLGLAAPPPPKTGPPSII